MNKIAFYILLVLIYLGLSKSFLHDESVSLFIDDESFFNERFVDDKTTIILTQSYSTGVFIKSYHHQYKVIQNLRRPIYLFARTSQEFYKKHEKNIGLSIYRKMPGSTTPSYTPLPPGIIFIANVAFGSWVIQNGEKYWRFYRAYRYFPKRLGWGDFRPTYKFYRQMVEHQKNNQAFYGPNNEFGTQGSITQQTIYAQHRKQTAPKIFTKNLWSKYLQLP